MVNQHPEGGAGVSQGVENAPQPNRHEALLLEAQQEVQSEATGEAKPESNTEAVPDAKTEQLASVERAVRVGHEDLHEALRGGQELGRTDGAQEWGRAVQIELASLVAAVREKAERSGDMNTLELVGVVQRRAQEERGNAEAAQTSLRRSMGELQGYLDEKTDQSTEASVMSTAEVEASRIAS